ncbi:MAG: hypothetical protein JNG84_10935, partial [Archangium sp.]|nr:hypothetical protein [Archangium sp.]
RFFVDLAWMFSSTSEGTQQVSAATTNHLVMLAPALAFPIGGVTSPFAFYAQLGAGLNSSTSTLRIDSTSTPVNGGRFVFQYGVGLRGRPTLLSEGGLRWAFRVEVTRFVRGYMQDTFIGAGVGAIF